MKYLLTIFTLQCMLFVLLLNAEVNTPNITANGVVIKDNTGKVPLADIPSGVGGGITLETISSDHALTVADDSDKFIVGDPTSDNVNISLPTLSSGESMRFYVRATGQSDREVRVSSPSGTFYSTHSYASGGSGNRIPITSWTDNGDNTYDVDVTEDIGSFLQNDQYLIDGCDEDVLNGFQWGVSQISGSVYRFTLASGYAPTSVNGYLIPNVTIAHDGAISGALWEPVFGWGEAASTVDSDLDGFMTGNIDANATVSVTSDGGDGYYVDYDGSFWSSNRPQPMGNHAGCPSFSNGNPIIVERTSDSYPYRDHIHFTNATSTDWQPNFSYFYPLSDLVTGLVKGSAIADGVFGMFLYFYNSVTSAGEIVLIRPQAGVPPAPFEVITP